MKNNHKRQDHLVNSLTEVTAIQTTENGLYITTAEAHVNVTVFNEQIVQVKAIQSHRPFEAFSYAVEQQPVSTAYTIEKSENTWSIKTNALTLNIQLNPLRFSLYNAKGELLNKDEDAFGISFIGHEVYCYKALQPNEKFIGLGEKTGPLNRKGAGYVNWNTDFFAYPANADPIYLSAPFYMGIHNQNVYGLFFDNTYKTEFNFGASNHRFSSFSAPDGECNYYYIAGENVAEIISAYTWLTGRTPLPPKWSLGFQQCRYSYYPDHEVISLAQNFRNRAIPCDVIYLDIHYMDSYKAFTWDKERFKDPDAMIAKLKDMGFHLVIIVDPGVKIEEGYTPYHSGLEADHFIKYPDGEPYIGSVWPGECHFPDFTKPETRKWWGDQYSLHVNNGIEGYWNDMNEPAVWGKRMPENVLFDYEGLGATHRKAHNVYGMNMAKSTYEGVQSLLNGNRPFVLTRAGYAGVQRYAAVWTGDNIASDDHMMSGIRLVNSMGLTGIPFSGYDVGGFAGEPSTDLFCRWFSIAAFSPFFRAHSMINSRDAEPWAFGEEAEEIVKNYIQLRYKLMDYLYTAFYEAANTGMPVARSLVIDYTFDEKIYQGNFQNQFLFGQALLVCPVPSHQLINKVYLPEGNWYDLYTSEKYVGSTEHFVATPKDRLPLFVKAGAILPLSDVALHLNNVDNDTLFLHVYKGEGEYLQELYEDDGQTYNYHNNQDCILTSLHVDHAKNVLKAFKTNGNRKSRFKNIEVLFHGFNPISQVAVNQNEITLEMCDYRFVAPISDFDPWHYSADQSKVVKNLQKIRFSVNELAFEITWK